MTNKFLSVVVFVLAFCPGLTKAQDSLTLSVSPTLFEMSANPGQEWKSTVRIINVNNFDLTVYADVVNFAPQGEGGEGLFLPVFEEETEGTTLAEWIEISREPIVIPRQQTMDLPFTVRVPEGANPGGHFAAILIGNKPPNPEPGTAKVQTAQMVTSLFFVRIAGDVIESGNIREFTTADYFLAKPATTFELRFENDGNVHIQPQGDIRIYNMWGQERGVIPINRYAHFGNVLPGSIRKFTFAWEGEWALADIGRYSAIVTLGYGVDERKFISSKTYFWVIPIKEVLIFLLALSLVISLGVWLIKIYIRRMLSLAGVDIEANRQLKKVTLKNSSRAIKEDRQVSVAAPLKAGILDLRIKLHNSQTISSKIKAAVRVTKDNWKFLLGVIILLIVIAFVIWYVKAANVSNRGFEVTYQGQDNEVKINSEELAYDELKKDTASAAVSPTSSSTTAIVNRSGKVGTGAETKLLLEKSGYQVTEISSDLEEGTQPRTVIVYKSGYEAEALKISALLNNALVSAYSEDGQGQEQAIIIYAGTDLVAD